MFHVVSDLQVIGAELISCRLGFSKQVFRLHTHQFLERVNLLLPDVKKKLPAPVKVQSSLTRKKLPNLISEALDYVCEVFENKFEENKYYLIHDEKKIFGDDIISIIYDKDFVTLSDGEIYAIKKRIVSLSCQYEIPIEQVVESGDLKTFFSYETVNRKNSNPLYRQIAFYSSDDGCYQQGSLCDCYLTTCVSLLNNMGAPWEKYLWGAQERSDYVASRRYLIKCVFDDNFREMISKAFHGKFFAGAIKNDVIGPIVEACQKRIDRLIELEKALQLNENFLLKEKMTVEDENQNSERPMDLDAFLDTL